VFFGILSIENFIQTIKSILGSCFICRSNDFNGDNW